MGSVSVVMFYNKASLTYKIEYVLLLLTLLLLLIPLFLCLLLLLLWDSESKLISVTVAMDETENISSAEINTRANSDYILTEYLMEVEGATKDKFGRDSVNF